MSVNSNLKMAVTMNIPVLALVENMSYVECPDCNKKIEVFDKSRCDNLAKTHTIPVTAKLPINPLFATACDNGAIESVETDSLDEIIAALTKLST